MKKKSLVLMLLLALVAAVSLFAFAGCGGGEGGGEGNGSDTPENPVPEGMTEYVFEAEWSPDIEFMSGFDYSGTISGLDMIQRDYYEKGASNGYYVTGLYGEGLSLAYTITSDKAVDDATFAIRISAEYMDISLTSSSYQIAVNGNDIAYRTIKLDNVPVSDRANMLEFEDFVLTQTLSLKEGENTVTFTTSNSTPMMGTMYATAPLVDCFKIKTSAKLTWDPCMTNTGQ